MNSVKDRVYNEIDQYTWKNVNNIVTFDLRFDVFFIAGKVNASTIKDSVQVQVQLLWNKP